MGLLVSGAVVVRHLRNTEFEAMIRPMEPSATEPLAPPHAPTPGAPKSKGLNAESNPLCVQMLFGLRNGLAQALLYTEGTKQFERTCTATFGAVSAVLNAIGSFKVGIAKTDALVNGERVDTPGSMRPHIEYIEKVMDAAGTSSLKFDRGLEEREIGPFLQLLARKKFPAGESSKINEFLQQQGIPHIQIEELRYVALADDEKVYTGGGPVPGTHAVAQKALSELVDATLASIDKVADGEAQMQLRAELTDQLIEKSDAMLENVLHTAAQRVRINCTESQAALMAVPQRDGKLLTDTLVLGKMLLAKGFAPDDDSLKHIRQILEGIVQPYKSHAEDIIAKVSLDKESFALLPEWLVRANASQKGGSAAERVEGILCQSPNALLDEQMFAQIVDVLDELSVAAMDQEAEQLSEHMAKALRAPTKRERMKAVERLSYLLERSLEQSSNAVRKVEDGLLAACTHETCDEVLKMLLAHLSQRCIHHYKLGNYPRAAEYAEWISGLEESSRSALKDEGANLARLAREELGKSEFVAALPSDVLDKEEKGKTALRIIQMLGASAWSAVVRALREETDTEKAAALTATVKQLGPQAVQMFFESLAKESDGTVAMRLLNLAPQIGDEAMLWAQIQPLLRHADGTVCGAALAVVLNRDGQPAVDALCAVLRDESDPERRIVWIGALSRLQHNEAQQVLLGELDEAVTVAEPDEVLLTAIVEALSAAGNAGVVRAIATLTAPRTPALPKSVILMALKALGPFYTDPLAVEVLERARKDKDPEIQRLALVVLRGIVAAEKHVVDQALAEAAAAAAAQAPVEEAPKKNTVRKPRRGFEALAGNQVDEIFQVGGAKPAEEESPSFLQQRPAQHKAEPERAKEPWLDTRPTLEGRVQDLGLPTTIRIVGGKDGVLRVYMPEQNAPEGRIFIRGKKILNATIADRVGMQALYTLDAQRGTHYAYYPTPISVQDAKLDIEIDKVQDALRRFRDQQPDENVFYE
jgi:hypothetical protein